MAATKALSFSFCCDLFRVEDVTEASATLRLVQIMYQYDITNWSCRLFSLLLLFRRFLAKPRQICLWLALLCPPSAIEFMRSGHETDLSEGRGQKPKRQQRLTDVPNMKSFYRAQIFPLFHLLSSTNYVFMAYKHILFQKSNFYLLIFKSVFYNKHFFASRVVGSQFLWNHPALTGLNRYLPSF